MKSIRRAFAGITKDGGSYFNMQHDQEDVAEVRSFANALALAGVPQKDTLYFARLSPSETARRAAVAPTENQISAQSQVPEYVDTYYCVDTEEGNRFIWDEPSARAEFGHLTWTDTVAALECQEKRRYSGRKWNDCSEDWRTSRDAVAWPLAGVLPVPLASV